MWRGFQTDFCLSEQNSEQKISQKFEASYSSLVHKK